MSNATGLTQRVMQAVQGAPNVDALPPIQEAMDAMMDDGLRLIGQKNAEFFGRSDTPQAHGAQGGA